MLNPRKLKELPDFSLVLGGPLFQLFRKAHLAGDGLELLRRRVLVLAALSWLPPLVLSVYEGHLLGGVRIPFLHDVETAVRFLVTLPAMIVAEMVVHARLRLVISEFIERDLIPEDQLDRFYAAIDAAVRQRNSVVVEVGMIVLIYSLGLAAWRNGVALPVDSWYALLVDGRPHLTMAGSWLSLVSIPIFQFLWLRWGGRLVIWYRLMWRISRLNVRLSAVHPDRAGGLAFLTGSARALIPLLFGLGASLSGWIANRVLFDGQSPLAFQAEAITLVVLLILVALGPMLFFWPKLLEATRVGALLYGRLAASYTRQFQEKWIDQGATTDDQLLGSGDIQSLADLGNSFAFVAQTRPVPFGKDVLIGLTVATVAPLAPLVLAVIPLKELVGKLVQMVL